MNDPWIVSIKGAQSLNKDVEVSILRASNKHGQISWGWEGKQKIVLKCNKEVDVEVLEGLAHVMASYMNNVETANGRSC